MPNYLLASVRFIMSWYVRLTHMRYHSAQTSHVIGYLLLVVVKLVTVRWCGFCMVNDENRGVFLLLTVVFPAKPVQWNVAILGNVYLHVYCVDVLCVC